jgi:SPFH domain / Band 7 family
MEVLFGIAMGVAGVLVGLALVLLFLMLIAPLYIPSGMFVNNPTKEDRSGFHLFTFIEPGKVKIITRGERIIRMVMDTDGKKFARKGSPQGEKYWEIVKGESEDPMTDINPLLRWWARYVFKFTGAVFTGIYPFQRVREYKLERTAISKQEGGDVALGETVVTDRESDTNIVLEVKDDYSDHYRLRMFLYPMHIKGAETKDKVPLDILGVAEMYVVNPHKAAFGTDRWDQAVVNTTTDALNTVTKTLTVDQILTAENEEDAQKISKAVTDIKKDTKIFGIQIVGFKVLEINPDLPDDELKKLRAEAMATQQGKATVIDGKTRAEAQEALNKANQVGDLAASVETMKTEGLVRAAKAAGEGGGNVILMAGANNQADPTQAAILAELQKLNKAKV